MDVTCTVPSTFKKTLQPIENNEVNKHNVVGRSFSHKFKIQHQI